MAIELFGPANEACELDERDIAIFPEVSEPKVADHRQSTQRY
jgi:hypothetical protein